MHKHLETVFGHLKLTMRPLTKEEENKRQRIAKEQSSGDQRKTLAGEPNHEKAAPEVKRNEAKLQNPSLLDTGIDQI